MEDVLFVMEPDEDADPNGDAKNRVALGTAAEHEAISLLLRRGYKVAVPVVDDDGVDLIVDYRTTVQVKSTTENRRNRPPRIKLVAVSYSNGQLRSQRPALKAHVDVVMARVEGVGWWIIPTASLPSPTWGLSLDGQYDCYRDAWHIFDSSNTAAA